MIEAIYADHPNVKVYKTWGLNIFVIGGYRERAILNPTAFGHVETYYGYLHLYPSIEEAKEAFPNSEFILVTPPKTYNAVVNGVSWTLTTSGDPMSELLAKSERGDIVSVNGQTKWVGGVRRVVINRVKHYIPEDVSVSQYIVDNFSEAVDVTDVWGDTTRYGYEYTGTVSGSIAALSIHDAFEGLEKTFRGEKVKIGGVTKWLGGVEKVIVNGRTKYFPEGLKLRELYESIRVKATFPLWIKRAGEGERELTYFNFSGGIIAAESVEQARSFAEEVTSRGYPYKLNGVTYYAGDTVLVNINGFMTYVPTDKTIYSYIDDNFPGKTVKIVTLEGQGFCYTGKPAAVEYVFGRLIDIGYPFKFKSDKTGAELDSAFFSFADSIFAVPVNTLFTSVGMITR